MYLKKGRGRVNGEKIQQKMTAERENECETCKAFFCPAWWIWRIGADFSIKCLGIAVIMLLGLLLVSNSTEKEETPSRQQEEQQQPVQQTYQGKSKIIIKEDANGKTRIEIIEKEDNTSQNTTAPTEKESK